MNILRCLQRSLVLALTLAVGYAVLPSGASAANTGRICPRLLPQFPHPYITSCVLYAGDCVMDCGLLTGTCQRVSDDCHSIFFVPMPPGNVRQLCDAFQADVPPERRCSAGGGA